MLPLILYNANICHCILVWILIWKTWEHLMHEHVNQEICNYTMWNLIADHRPTRHLSSPCKKVVMPLIDKTPIWWCACHSTWQSTNSLIQIMHSPKSLILDALHMMSVIASPDWHIHVNTSLTGLLAPLVLRNCKGMKADYFDEENIMLMCWNLRRQQMKLGIRMLIKIVYQSAWLIWGITILIWRDASEYLLILKQPFCDCSQQFHKSAHLLAEKEKTNSAHTWSSLFCHRHMMTFLCHTSSSSRHHDLPQMLLAVVADGGSCLNGCSEI